MQFFNRYTDTFKELAALYAAILLAGAAVFAAEHERELGTLYLTDFLAKHFDALVWQGLGLDRHPELRVQYFGNYTRVLLISQTNDPSVLAAGRSAAAQVGLPFVHRHVGLEPFADAVGLVVRSAQP